MIVVQFVLGKLYEFADQDGERVRQIALIANHKSIGMTVLMLAVMRLVWRLNSTIPQLPKKMPGWQKSVSGITHWALYGALFALPLTGWLMSSASAYSVSWFGLFTWPDLIEPDKALRTMFANWHEIIAQVLFVIALLHIAAALKHHWLDKDDVLKRMTSGTWLTVFAALIIAALWALIPTRDSTAASRAVQSNVTAAPAAATEKPASSLEVAVTEETLASSMADTANDTETPTVEDPATASEPPPSETTADTESPQETAINAASSTPEPEVSAAQTVAAPVAAPEPAVADLWSVDSATSYVRFVAEQAGAEFTGEWQQWQADMRFSADALDTSQFVVTFDTNSVSTNDDDRDGTLLDAEWFDAAQFPTITFETRTIKAEGDAFVADAELLIKGARYPVRFNFTVTRDGTSRQLTGNANLDRLALNIGTGEWTDTEWVGQFVEVNVLVNATIDP